MNQTDILLVRTEFTQLPSAEMCVLVVTSLRAIMNVEELEHLPHGSNVRGVVHRRNIRVALRNKIWQRVNCALLALVEVPALDGWQAHID